MFNPDRQQPPTDEDIYEVNRSWLRVQKFTKLGYLGNFKAQKYMAKHAEVLLRLGNEKLRIPYSHRALESLSISLAMYLLHTKEENYKSDKAQYIGVKEMMDAVVTILEPVKGANESLDDLVIELTMLPVADIKPITEPILG